MNTTLARNVIPFPRSVKRVVPVFSADPKHAGIYFPRTSVDAWRGPEYAASIFTFSRPPWYVRLWRAVREILTS